MLLLDTHAFLWFEADSIRLSQRARNLINNSDAVFVSIASFWEMAIKQNFGKLDLGVSISELMDDCDGLGFDILPIRGSHLERLKDLPFIHRDPFDRLLICQAQAG